MKLQTLFFTNLPRHPQRRSERAGGRARGLFDALIVVGLLLASSPGFAKSSVAFPATEATLVSSHLQPQTKTAPSGPLWSELTPGQQRALLPLASDWNGISEAQKRKWLEISNNYRTLTPAKKAKLTSRMKEWVALSPQQRAQARLNFGKTKELSRQLTPEEKKAKWNAYQALSPEEKKKLAAKASRKPSGAATAIKPVPPHKLAALPAPSAAPKITDLPSATPIAAPVSANATPRR